MRTVSPSPAAVPKYTVDGVPALKIEFLLDDFKMPQIVAAIRLVTCSEGLVDDRISIIPISDVIRMRTGERGSNAL